MDEPPPPDSRMALTRRRVLGTGVAMAAAAAVPRSPRAEAMPVLDDASRLNPTRVARHVVLGPDPDAVLLTCLRAELREAAAAGRPVALGAARHSMGGQSLAAGGTALTFAPGGCFPDRVAGTFRAGAGARWRDVIAALDPLGLSPAVMQSNNDFGVASSFSVNAHGWPVPRGPFGTTVRALRLMLADGTVVACSRGENAELFRAAMGGYGLLGIALDLEVEAVPNRLLAPSFEVLPAAAFAARFVALCADPAIAMAYGRLNVAARGFLAEAVLVGYRPVPAPRTGLARAGTGGPAAVLAREVYRGQTGSEAGKRLRWYAETEVAPHALGNRATRNRLLNEPAASLAGRAPGRTDILHEYFVPPDRLAEFLLACREIIPRSRQELLNVTLRFVGADPTSLLAYAPGPRIAAVMAFSQRRTAEAEADMRRMTQALVDAALGLGGSFYLPYRLHARREQVERAYPNFARFAALKRRHDPGLLFRNALWDAWLASPSSGSG